MGAGVGISGELLFTSVILSLKPESFSREVMVAGAEAKGFSVLESCAAISMVES